MQTEELTYSRFISLTSFEVHIVRIININGPINAGKTTISKLLSAYLPRTLFVEVDDLLSDEEQADLGLSRQEGWQERCKRLADIVQKEKKARGVENIIFAYPMTEKLYAQWKQWEDETVAFINITLAPQMEICLQNRGARELDEGEKKRIKEMYQEGYHNSKFVDLIIDNSKQTPQETLNHILLFLGRENDYQKV